MSLARQFTIGRLRKRARQGYVRLLQSPGAPAEVAGGMALGLFVALLPIMGLQMPIAVALAELARRLLGVRLSRVAAAAGVWLTNPATAAPIYGLCYLIGLPFARGILGASGSGAAAQAVATLPDVEVGTAVAAGHSLGLEVALALCLGGIAVALPVAFAGYRLTYGLVERYQDRRAQRKARAPLAADVVMPS